MLTVSQALELEVLKGSYCVGGNTGLGREIKWVHNVGVPDAANWLNGGEFVLTTYINLPTTQAEQRTTSAPSLKKGSRHWGWPLGAISQKSQRIYAPWQMKSGCH